MKTTRAQRISPEGLAFIMHWEGWRPEAYKDAAGLWTIGAGHLLTPRELEEGRIWIDGKRVDIWSDLDDVQISKLLAQDARTAQQAINDLITAELSQEQFDALCSWAFNVGSGAVSKSTLRRKLNTGFVDDVPTELVRWNKAGGKFITGLANRRWAECQIWEQGRYILPGPDLKELEPHHLVSFEPDERNIEEIEDVDTKPAVMSTSIIGSMAVIISMALSMAGIPIGSEAIGELGNQAVALAGSAVAIWGRIRATKKIEGVITNQA